MSEENVKERIDEVVNICEGFGKASRGHEIRNVLKAISCFVVSMVEGREQSELLLKFMLEDIQKDAKRTLEHIKCEQTNV